MRETPGQYVDIPRKGSGLFQSYAGIGPASRPSPLQVLATEAELAGPTVSATLSSKPGERLRDIYRRRESSRTGQSMA
jgi:hypothetical protein